MPKRAVLLVNLGSPDSTAVPDVRRYLREFLGDERVIDLKPRWAAWLLVNGIITTFRAPKSAHAYEQVWTKDGSPLITTSKAVREKLAAALATPSSVGLPLAGRPPQSSSAERSGPAASAGPTSETPTPVYLAMRYGTPSIASVITQMAADGIDDVLLVPQYPHYAMSSWETVVVKVYAEAAQLAPKMRVECIQPFYQDADYIEALHTVCAPYFAQPHDYVLFSYHGIPVRHLRKADSSKGHCTVVPDCCETCSPIHSTCYKAQCLATTRALVARAKLPADKYSVSFQSRLAGEPWLTPFTDHELVRLPKEGKKRLLIICPAFVADCLETLEEIRGEGKETFVGAGGESFEQIPCLNDHPAYIDFLAKRVRLWLTSERA